MRQREPDRVVFAIGLMLCAYFLFSGVDASVKWLSAAGFAAVQLAFMRYAGHAVLSLAVVVRHGRRAVQVAPSERGQVVLRALCILASTVLNFIAIRYLPLTLTATIMFSVPLIVCALSGPVLGERVGPWRWGAVAVGFAGVLIAMRPFSAQFHWAMVLSLATALSFAGYTLLTRKLAGRVSPEAQQLYTGLVGVLALGPVTLSVWQSPDNGLDWALLIGVGGLAWVGHEIMTRAHAHAPASVLSPFLYSLLPFMGFWSYTVFGHVPDTATVVGAGTVILAGLVIWARERRSPGTASEGRPPR
ncbi:MAG: DMT family transporter [Pseudomonadota bacterium]